MKRRLAISFGLFLIVTSAAARAAVPTLQAAPSRALEPLYSEAVLDFQENHPESALAKVEKILATAPDRKTLELKALILKAMNRLPEARAAFMDLDKRIRASSRNPADLAPAEFEIAMIDFAQGRTSEVRARLAFCIAHPYNLGAAHLFMGLLDLDAGDLESSVSHFSQVLSSDAESLKPLAQLYLAKVSANQGDLESTLRSLSAARELALSNPPDLINAPEDVRAFRAQVREKILESLRPVNSSRWFGSLLLAAGGDTNVLSVPGTGSVLGTTNGNASGTGLAKLSLGYASKPLEPLQWVPSYQGSINYETNRNVETGQFVTHDLALYINRHPYEKTSYGAKLEGIGLFQYQVDPTSNVGTFGPYSLQGSFGPYYRRELAPHRLWTTELDFEPRKNYLDPAFSPQARKSGYDVLMRTSIASERGARFWNPTWSLTAAYNQTDGDEYRSGSAAMALTDVLHLRDGLLGTASAQLGASYYPDRPSAPRFDKTAILEASATLLLNRDFSVLADLQYQINLSNIASIYQYQRGIGTVGVAYNL